jgi:hypothetical protein
MRRRSFGDTAVSAVRSDSDLMSYKVLSQRGVERVSPLALQVTKKQTMN